MNPKKLPRNHTVRADHNRTAIPKIGWIEWMTGIIYFFTTSPPVTPQQEVQQFISNMELKYNIKNLFIEKNWDQACKLAKSQFKLLLIYIHSPLHEQTNDFCNVLMKSELFSSFIRENFIVWGASVRGSEGYHVSGLLRCTGYPALAVVANNTVGGLTLLDRIEGEQLLVIEDLMNHLTTVLASHGESLSAARLVQEERETSRKLMEEQDDEYLRALEADQQKEREIQEAEIRKKKEQEQKEREENERLEKLKQKEERKEKILSKLPNEPAANEQNITQLIIRLTDGSRMQRRFRSTDTIEVVFAFVDTKEPEVEHYDLVTNFPKKLFGENEKTLTLKEAGLCPQASLFVQTRD